MTTEEQAKLAVDLMDRAADQIRKCADMMRPMTYGAASALARSMELLDSVTSLVDEHAPDERWWRDYFTLTGEHMILTEEGWELGELKGYDDAPDILDEVNAPEGEEPK